MNGFKCAGCGGCCRVSGYVRLLSDEPARIAAYLGISPREFNDRYTRLTEDRSGLSLTERPDHTCVFLAEVSTCRINAVKPAQCRSFPLLWHFEGWEKLCEGAGPTR